AAPALPALGSRSGGRAAKPQLRARERGPLRRLRRRSSRGPGPRKPAADRTGTPSAIVRRRAGRSHLAEDWVRSAKFVLGRDLRPLDRCGAGPRADELAKRLVALRPRLALVSVELQQVWQTCDESAGGQVRRRGRLVRAGDALGRLDPFGGEAKRRDLG